MRLFIRCAGEEIRARVFLHRIVHRKAAEGGRKVDLLPLIGDLRGAVHHLATVGEQVFGKLHHAVIVRIGLIQLDGGEFRVMRCIHALVAEDAADFIHALQPAHDAHFQVQLRGDAHIHVDIQRIVVRDERARRSTGSRCVEHGRFHLNEAPCVQAVANLRDDL